MIVHLYCQCWCRWFCFLLIHSSSSYTIILLIRDQSTFYKRLKAGQFYVRFDQEQQQQILHMNKQTKYNNNIPCSRASVHRRLIQITAALFWYYPSTKHTISVNVLLIFNGLPSLTRPVFMLNSLHVFRNEMRQSRRARRWKGGVRGDKNQNWHIIHFVNNLKKEKNESKQNVKLRNKQTTTHQIKCRKHENKKRKKNKSKNTTRSKGKNCIWYKILLSANDLPMLYVCVSH